MWIFYEDKWGGGEHDEFSARLVGEPNNNKSLVKKGYTPSWPESVLYCFMILL